MGVLGRACGAALALVLTGFAARAADRAATIDAGAGAQLHGALRVPDGWTGGPAVLMVPGSGAPDRDGNTAAAGFFGNNLKLLADGLEAAGVASLRIDKRCIAESALACPGEEKLTIGLYADDAAAWARFLAAQPKVSCVVLLGHSEGALVVALAAAKVKTCGVVSVSGVGRNLADVIEEQVRNAGAPTTVQAKIHEIDVELRAGRPVKDAPPALAGLFRPSVQPFVISEYAVDPAAAFAAFKGPALIVQGSTDLQVSVDDARRLAAARPGAKLVVVEGANHVLKSAPLDRAANLATYRDVGLPLAPGVLDPIVAFVKAEAKPAA